MAGLTAAMEPVMMVGIVETSDGLRAAREQGLKTTAVSFDIENGDSESPEDILKHIEEGLLI